MSAAQKIMPVKSPESMPYWEGLRARKILIPECKDCGHTFFYPRTQCTKCLSPNLAWKEIPPRAKLWTWTVVHQSFHEGWAADVPFVIALVEVLPGVRMMTNIVECSSFDDLKIGMDLEGVFDDVRETTTLLKFRPTYVEVGA
jgi:uncharacterized OB-fold protein